MLLIPFARTCLGQSSFEFDGDGISMALSLPVKRVSVKASIIALNGENFSILISQMPLPPSKDMKNQLSNLAIRFLKGLKNQQGVELSQERLSEWTIGKSKTACGEAVMKMDSGVQKVCIIYADIHDVTYQLQVMSGNTNFVAKDVILKLEEPPLKQ